MIKEFSKEAMHVTYKWVNSFLNNNGILIPVSHWKKVMCNGQTKMATSGLFRFLSDIFDELTSLKLEGFFGSSYGCYYIRIGNRH